LPVTKILKKHYVLVVIECHRCGGSEHTANGCNPEQCALDSIELMHQLGHDRFSLAGHSAGGGIRMTLAL